MAQGHRIQIRRKRVLPENVIGSPPDSGYGSAENTPERFRNPSWNCLKLDGADSDDEEWATRVENGTRRWHDDRKPATLPRMLKYGSAVPSAFFSDLQTSPPAAPATKPRAARYPDRFLPVRDNDTPVSIKFRTAKSTHSMSAAEKILRHNGASRDSFISRPARNSVPRTRHARMWSRADAAAHASVGLVLFPLQQNQNPEERQASIGTVWTVGGAAPPAIDDGQGGLFHSGTTARLFPSSFAAGKTRAQEDHEKHEDRLASALKLDRVQKILEIDHFVPTSRVDRQKTYRRSLQKKKTTWDGITWVNEQIEGIGSSKAASLPVEPYRILDAPNLRDDFYCSPIAYSHTRRTLAMGLGSALYAWTEASGPNLLRSEPGNDAWITCVAFSSVAGCKGILALSRCNGHLSLTTLEEAAAPRFDVQHPFAVTCVSWRPCCSLRPSKNPLNPGNFVSTEDLLVGDERGDVFYYIVEWPMSWEVKRDTWPGTMTLVARISSHTQQICGLSWSPDGEMFATGGNDNLCCLFDISQIFGCRHPTPPDYSRTRGHADRWTHELHYGSPFRPADDPISVDADGLEVRTVRTEGGSVKTFRAGSERRRWLHGAAVKAIAFCPWREGLLATGGGSNDRCIHFYHTTTGAALATIAVSAQVTSLIWSTTRREIAATFGYAEPSHPFRIAVFSWPDCQQVATIPWQGDHRALYAIPFPGGPGCNRDRRRSRTAREGCIVVAASDSTLKFHEVWAADLKPPIGGPGTLGGSDILEGIEGIDKEGDLIR